MHELKLRFFGSETIVLHTADMTRNRKGFEGLKDPATRQRWYQALNAAMARWKYTVVAVVIDKLRHREAYGDAALDPYELSLALVAERLVLEAEKLKARVELVAESRGHHLDTRLNRVWEVQTVEQ
ncbi:hypothetical protein [Thermus thalpophilus]|uniref:hypothetical protein n=1 Tax=Thermus thalpophilus TaxID=2908147 RepID=UPI001FAA76E8|nr:hypothetical protein [Thermus thalpophilus]